MLAHEKQIQEYKKTIERLKQNKDSSLFSNEIRNLELKLDSFKEKVYSELTPWERIQICRDTRRPQTSYYTQKLCDEFCELSGDRAFRNDNAILGGFAKIGPMSCVVIGQEKGNDTETRIHRNFGMVAPEGFRKALRLMKLAEKFSLPVVTFIDTPGAHATLEAEQRGQAWAIAQNLRDMARLKTPIIVVVIGEGCSGGALGIGVGDVVGMLEHAYYSVISPESGSAILWKDSGRKEEAAKAMKLNAENLLELDVIDAIIKEPLGGAHNDPENVVAEVRRFILEQWAFLSQLDTETLLHRRYLKFRSMGKFLEGASEGSQVAQ